MTEALTHRKTLTRRYSDACRDPVFTTTSYRALPPSWVVGRRRSTSTGEQPSIGDRGAMRGFASDLAQFQITQSKFPTFGTLQTRCGKAASGRRAGGYANAASFLRTPECTLYVSTAQACRSKSAQVTTGARFTRSLPPSILGVVLGLLGRRRMWHPASHSSALHGQAGAAGVRRSTLESCIALSPASESSTMA